MARPFDHAVRPSGHPVGPPGRADRPPLLPGKAEVRRYKAIYVLDDAEIGQASDEVVVSCLP